MPFEWICGESKIMRAIICGLFAFAMTLSGFAGGYLAIPKTDREPRIDGLVTPRERSQCSMTTLTLMGALAAPENKTEIYACATPRGVYFGFVCYDTDPSGVQTSVTQENGPVMKDDSVEFVLCPTLVGERDNYFHFAVNAAGVRYSWDAHFDRPVSQWQAAAQKTPSGWEAEAFIPFSSIRGRTDINQWRANFLRTRTSRHSKPPEVSVWVDPGLTIHNYKKLGFLRFVEPKEEDIESLLKQLMELREQEASAARQNEEGSTATAVNRKSDVPRSEETSSPVTAP